MPPRHSYDAPSTVRDGLPAVADDAAPAPRTTVDGGAARGTGPETTLDATRAAPATTLDTAPRPQLDGSASAPRTTLDAGAPAPGTTLDAGAPAPGTTLDAGAPAPGTTLDQAVGGASATVQDAVGAAVPPATAGGGRPIRHRVNLPAALADDYEVVRMLGSGGEADLLLVTERATGDPVVVRLYRRAGVLDVPLLERLQRADRGHVIGLLGWGQDDEAAWELLEYASHGTLADVLRRDGAPWSPDRVDAVLTELTDALAFVHSLGLVHRDVKPQNILVRSVQPLDLVLSDFGLTRVVAASEMEGTTSRTAAYAAPEAATGAISPGLDWWPLGLIVAELLTGSHPFRRADGTWISDMQIMRFLLTNEVPLDAVTDERWRDLCRGLLTRDVKWRWRAEQVRRWRRGERPEIHVPAPADRAQTRPFTFGNRIVRSPAELAAAFRANWAEAVRLLRGAEMNAPAYLDLCEWAAAGGQVRASRILSRPSPPDRALTQLILALDPGSEPVYRGRPVSRAGLARLIEDAVHDPGAAAVLDAVYAEEILTAVDGPPHCAGLAEVDARWRRLVAATERFTPPQHRQLLTGERRRVARIRLLVAALLPDQPSQSAGAARRAREDTRARTRDWFRTLAALDLGPDQVAADELIAQLHDVALAEADQARAAMEHAAAVAEQQRQLERRRRFDRVSGSLSIVCFFLAWTPIGLVTAPAAVYFSIRGRRSRPAGCLGGLALWGGILLTIGWWAALFSDMRLF